MVATGQMYFCAQKIWPLSSGVSRGEINSPRNSGYFVSNIKTCEMPRKESGEKKELRHEIKTRVNQQKFNELNDLLAKTKCRTMSELVRNILYNKPIKVYTIDESFPRLMEEISGVRKELKAIGININQVTRYFNSSPGSGEKLIYSFEIERQFQKVGVQVQLLLPLISKLSEKWLQE